MRRSKSNPAKYARNYRKISQRHMTVGGNGKKEEGEEKRLESILHQSELTWKRGLAENGHSVGKKGKTKECDNDVDILVADGGTNKATNDAIEEEKGDDMLSLLSPELRAQFSGMNGDNLLILPSKKKKPNKKKELPPLSPQEIKAAKALYKNTQRKLQQLKQRKKQKEVRGELYKQLEQNTLLQHEPMPSSANERKNKGSYSGANNHISADEARSLLLKSSERGKKLTKKQRLKQLRKKEELGIPLTKEEMDILYVKYEAPSADSFPGVDNLGSANSGEEVTKKPVDGEGGEKQGALEDANASEKKKKKKSKKKRSKEGETDEGVGYSKDSGIEQSAKKARVTREANELDLNATEAVKAKEEPINDVEATCNKPKSFSEMIFAGLSSLKTKTDTQNATLANKKAEDQRRAEETAAKLDEEDRRRRNVYVPTEIEKVTTVHRQLKVNDDTNVINKTGSSKTENASKVQQVNRPSDVEESRYDLPVSTMEYEIVDAVRSHDCTILCGETGSGKSTQVPQFLYEAGFSTMGDYGGIGDSSEGSDSSGNLLIGITQPRRVAAVSTAKRVSYEMGFGNGQSIPSNNLVAYQTRYETAGLGGNTRVKFMTDGILLQEIQSDLLLRKYGAIVIDEAHERNLNTDVLLGLLSVALPLRRKASEESKKAAEKSGRGFYLPPLKLIIMSATLKVEDFTDNKRLFPKGSCPPALVKVPGRTYPVSIHHSKVTELDDYEKAAMEKVCKIHRKLPPGGILVFLTGKQEIVRCVNRLRQRLEPGNEKKGRPPQVKQPSFGGDDVNQSSAPNDDYFRDMDDDEVDGDLFQKQHQEGDDDFDKIDEDAEIKVAADVENDDDKRPKNVRILPLYSMLSADEQAKVFASVEEDTRLIVVATNIAETSITIPGIAYVVDSGRQKCRNYHAGTGVASYDVMWISKAAADQRAGRAGRTGPGHCYRLYSSSVYSRYLDDFALPEVLTRPLEDVVLAMKAMNVSNVVSFPFPTPPEQGQVTAAVRLLANLGCVDVSRVEEQGGDGKITPLGSAVAQLPLGVRYGKMLLVAAQANVLDYAIVLVAVLSESNLFVQITEEIKKTDDESPESSKELEGLDEVDRNQVRKQEKDRKRNEKLKSKWQHDGGDVLSAVKAVGAYAYAGRGAGGASEQLACRKFCEENGLHFVVMQRIAKMRLHLCKLAKTRLPHAGGVAAATGTYLPTMPPPKRMQESLIQQAIASGLLDNIARRAPHGVLPSEFSGIPRSAYICANPLLKEPLFIDNNSTAHSKRPEWVCFDSIVRKTKKDGATVATMQRVTPIDPEWLATLCHGSSLMKLGSSPLGSPLPRYSRERDSIQCAVETKFGGHRWEIPPCYVDMYEAIQEESASNKKKLKISAAAMEDDSFRWFARYLLEGKVLGELSGLSLMLNDEPAIITSCKPAKKVMMIVTALSDAGIDSAAALRKHWAEKNNKFLFRELKPWVKQDNVDVVKQLWIRAVTSNVEAWKAQL